MAACCKSVSKEDRRPPPPPPAVPAPLSLPVPLGLAPPPTFVFALLGFGGVGRSSLATRIVYDTFSSSTPFSRTAEVTPPLALANALTLQIAVPVPLPLNLDFEKDPICARADAFLLCFDVTDAASLADVTSTTWLLCPSEKPLVVLGMLADAPAEEREITHEEAKRWCRAHGGLPYYEVSARTGGGVITALNAVLTLVSTKRKSDFDDI